MERKWYKKFSKNKEPSELSKLVSKRGLPKPLKVKCFQCKKTFFIKYVVVSKGYSKKNNWEYWTNPEADNLEFWKDKEARKKDNQVCDACLLALYYNKELFWETIKDPKKKQRMRTYVYTGTISE
ncbi:hypothetical protein [endosymbiont GvMRE of Glomus versiforme]|uniref:hypothetical protein n=1 Tax=endosymbiont GvMRE of Glomus versiforme TaxID=2039283 RepID=UPI000EEFD29D|nr:hypothetical protein [endosymbiont GvMRE of Glomus versiforme]RHZ36137.1 hypothetical protein GvMRE_Ic2g127 [endosymbiont GvMRE of Glomus versiforme]RHZ36284.1 hypothetical protein GvMRE_Ic1g68 [endosymbiont GvMRE of Glomus versiforme]